MKKKKIAGHKTVGGVERCSSLPLTSADIITLRGKPAVAKITKPSAPNNGQKPILQSREEWIYFDKDNKEYYFFENEQLVRWKKIPLSMSRLK